MGLQLIEVGSEAYIGIIRKAVETTFEFAKSIYQGEIDANRTVSRDEAMMAHMLNCKKSKLHNLIKSGVLEVTDTKPLHIYVRSIIAYKKSKLKK